MARVSVVIPAYNQARYLSDAIESVTAQTLHDLDIVVVDDGSTDGTAEVVAGFHDPRICYIYQENRGLSAARNTGIRESTGEFLSFLDSDDLFLPEKLELLVEALERDPDAGLAAGQAIPIDESGNRMGKVFDSPLPDNPLELLLGNPLHVGSVLLRRSWQEKVGFFDESLRSYEDWDMWLRLAFAGCRSAWVPRPVSLYRFHRAQMTRIGKQMTEATFAALDKFFARPDLTDECLRMKDRAYCRAHLRASAQAWLARDHGLASRHLSRAIEQDPSLLEDGAAALARQFRAWTELPKITRPLEFLEDIYDHLPEELSWLSRERKSHLAAAAVQLAFESFQAKDLLSARRYGLKAVAYRPTLLANRGLMSLLSRSMLQL